jgi:hypothetical protein
MYNRAFRAAAAVVFAFTAACSDSAPSPTAPSLDNEAARLAKRPLGSQFENIAVSGTVAGVSQFVGEFDITRFAVQGGQLVAVGTLTGTLTNLVTGVTQTVTTPLALPVQADGTCEILTLVLGPLDLDLLGLQVHLDQVVLEIEAQPGPGNLLGNLLCAIAGLLDSNAGLNQIAQLLNQLLGLLG